MSNTEVTASVSTTTVTVEENTVLIELNNVGIQGVPGANNDPTYVTVRNATGATLAKGTIVYISGANGNNVQVTPALATGDSTSARTIGWLSQSIANNASGLCMVEGYLEGINTQGFTAGDQLYLSGTVAGGFTATKPQAPIHLVYVGVVTKVSAGDGHVFVKVQNGYELEELHNVQIINPTNAQVLAYDSATQLWKNATNAPDGVTSITATAPLTGGTITSTGSIGLDQTAISITKSQVSDFTSGTVTSASTAQQAGTAVYSVNSGTAVYATTSGTAVTISGSITKSQVSDFTSGTVASADVSGTATYADTSGTATYATTSGTAVTISGDITKSQVSDFTSGTVTSASTAQQAGTAVFATTSGTATFATNAGTAVFATNASTAVTISGSIAQSQVTSLVTDLAAKANLAGGNAFTGAQAITGTVAGTAVASLQAASGQSVNILAILNSAGTDVGGFGNTGNLKVRTAVEFSGALNVAAASSTQIGAVIRGASGQTADLMQLQNNTGGVLNAVNSGGFNLTPGLRDLANSGAFINMQSATSGVLVNTRAAGNLGLVVRGAASQTANLQEWQNSAGTVLSRISADGSVGFAGANFSITSGGGVFAASVSTNVGRISMSEANSGGRLTIHKQTATDANPGANIGRIYLRDGTNAGTLKLVVRAGASGAETTILDNIPQ